VFTTGLVDTKQPKRRQYSEALKRRKRSVSGPA
jgi:hypothetical protein